MAIKKPTYYIEWRNEGIELFYSKEDFFERLEEILDCGYHHLLDFIYFHS